MSTHTIDFYLPPLTKKDLENVLDSLIDDDLLNGKICRTLETIASERLQKKFAISANSYTAAYHLIWLSLNLEPEDEIILPSFYYQQVLNSIHLSNAKPVLLDYEKDGFYYTIDSIIKKITEKTKAVIIGNLYGDLRGNQELERLRQKKEDLVIIQDLSHCLGLDQLPSHAHQQPIGDFFVISLAADSILTTGNGALVLLDSQTAYRTMADYRADQIKKSAIEKQEKNFLPDTATSNHQNKALKLRNRILGIKYNYRLADFQAALAIAQWKNLKKFNLRRNEIASIYRDTLVKTNHRFLKTDDQPISFRFPLVLDSDPVQAFALFRREKIRIAYQSIIPLHRILGLKNNQFLQSERLYRNCLEIPLYPQLNRNDVQRINRALAKIV